MITFSAIFCLTLIGSSVLLTKDKYNMFLISNVIFLATTFLLPFLGQFFEVDAITSVEGTLMYIVYFLIYFVFYILGRRSIVRSPVSELPNYKHNIYLNFVLIFSLAVNVLFVIYSIVSYGIQGTFINSREVYTTTRTGSGQIYYIATIFLFLYAIVGLFILKNKLLHFIVCVVFALPYGTKGKILVLAIYNFIYFLFASKHKVHLRKARYFIVIITMFPLLMLTAFWYTSIGLNSSAEVLRFAIGYGNEYENNFNDLINHFYTYFPHGHLHGEVFFGNSFYPFVPRVLWPDKPLYFGDLYLSYVIYPEATIANVGAPSFGVLGQPFADFGFWGGLVQIFIEQAILGYLLGKMEMKCLNKPGILNYTLLLGLSIGGLIALPGSEKLVITMINLIFFIIIFYPMKYKFVWKRKDTAVHPG